MTRAQLHQAQWVLLAGLPGSVLLLGGLVWLRRRK
jgi:LPXTG-motif cell wall-anchored protein